MPCNHRHHPAPEPFHHPEQKLGAHPTPAPSRLRPGNPRSTFCLWFDCSRDLMSDSTQHMLFCDWLIPLGMMSSRFIHVVACVRFHSTVRWNDPLLCVYIPPFVYPFVSWWMLGWCPPSGYREYSCSEYLSPCFQFLRVYA